MAHQLLLQKNTLYQASFYVTTHQKRSRLHEIMGPCQHPPLKKEVQQMNLEFEFCKLKTTCVIPVSSVQNSVSRGLITGRQ